MPPATTSAPGQPPDAPALFRQTPGPGDPGHGMQAYTVQKESRRCISSTSSRDFSGAAAAPPPSEKSLEEIQEMHLRDSFWTVP